jgi:hypothetical protein
MEEIALLLKALHFAVHKHQYQRRKDKDASPYINRPIEVAEIMANIGEVSDLPMLLTAVLLLAAMGKIPNMAIVEAPTPECGRDIIGRFLPPGSIRMLMHRICGGGVNGLLAAWSS